MSRRPNRVARLREASAQLRLRQQHERSLQDHLARELNRMAAAAATAYPAWEATLPTHREQLRLILRTAAKRAGLAMAHRARQQFRKAGEGAVESKIATADEMDAEIVRLVLERADEVFQDVWNVSKTRLKNAIRRGIEAGEGPNDIARRIRSEVEDMTVSRARTIARTETSIAMNIAQQAEMMNAEDELGIELEKTWTATEDERTRETHSEADGQTVPLNDDFEVGGTAMAFPSDPNGPPEEVINCRCAVIYSEVPTRQNTNERRTAPSRNVPAAIESD